MNTSNRLPDNIPNDNIFNNESKRRKLNVNTDTHRSLEYKPDNRRDDHQYDTNKHKLPSHEQSIIEPNTKASNDEQVSLNRERNERREKRNAHKDEMDQFISELEVKLKANGKIVNTQVLGLLLEEIHSKLESKYFATSHIAKLCRLLFQNYVDNNFIKRAGKNLKPTFSACIKLALSQISELCNDEEFSKKPINSSHLQHKLSSMANLIHYAGRLSAFSSCSFSASHLQYLLNEIKTLIGLFKNIPTKNIEYYDREKKQFPVITLKEITCNSIEGICKFVHHTMSEKITPEEINHFVQTINDLLKELASFNDMQSKRISWLFIALFDFSMIKDFPKDAFCGESLKKILEDSHNLNRLDDICMMLHTAGKLIWQGQLNITIDASKINETLRKLIPLSKTKLPHYQVIKTLRGVANLSSNMVGKIDVTIINDLLEINVSASDRNDINNQIQVLQKSEKLSNQIDPEKITKFKNSNSDGPWEEKILNKSNNEQFIFNNAVEEIFSKCNPKHNPNEFKNIFNKLQEVKSLSVQQLTMLAKLLNENMNKFLVKNSNGETDEILQNMYLGFVDIVLNHLSTRCDHIGFHDDLKNPKMENYNFRINLTAYLIHDFGYILSFEQNPYHFSARNLSHLLEHLSKLIKRRDVLDPRGNKIEFFDLERYITIAIYGAGKLIKSAIKEITLEQSKILENIINVLLEQLMKLPNISSRNARTIFFGIYLLTDKLSKHFVNYKTFTGLINKSKQAKVKPISQGDKNFNNIENQSIFNIDMLPIANHNLNIIDDDDFNRYPGFEDFFKNYADAANEFFENPNENTESTQILLDPDHSKVDLVTENKPITSNIIVAAVNEEKNTESNINKNANGDLKFFKKSPEKVVVNKVKNSTDKETSQIDVCREKERNSDRIPKFLMLKTIKFIFPTLHAPKPTVKKGSDTVTQVSNVMPQTENSNQSLPPVRFGKRNRQVID